MTLAEKILKLRTARSLSQGDLAEALEVSRQSVSKWETGQSVPDLDKIIKLADLFGVTVDELVREGERPQPPQPEPQQPAQPRVVYVEKKKEQTPIQILGIVLEGTGAGLAVIGIMGAPLLVFVGAALVILGLPLLLAKRHPLLICGWLTVGLSYLVFNRCWTSVSFYYVLTFLRGGKLTMQAIVSVGRLAGLLLMLICTLFTWQKNHKEKDG